MQGGAEVVEQIGGSVLGYRLAFQGDSFRFGEQGEAEVFAETLGNGLERQFSAGMGLEHLDGARPSLVGLSAEDAVPFFVVAVHEENEVGLAAAFLLQGLLLLVCEQVYVVIFFLADVTDVIGIYAGFLICFAAAEDDAVVIPFRLIVLLAVGRRAGSAVPVPDYGGNGAVKVFADPDRTAFTFYVNRI